MRKLILAVSLLAFVAVPASAAVQNVKVGGFVDSKYLYRENFDFGKNAVSGEEKQSVFLTHSGLRVDADLTDQVGATIALLNERVWEGAPAAADSDVSIFLAFVQLREFLYSPLTVVVGRQDFRYGNSFIFDSAGSNNTAAPDSGLQVVAGDLTYQTAIDAVRAILDYNPLTLELVFAQVDPNTVALNQFDDNKQLYGINATYELGDDMNSVVESYFWWLQDKSTTVDVANTPDERDIIKVTGLRGSTNPIEGLNIQAEYAFQGGTKTNSSSALVQRRKAHGVQAIANYQVPVMEEYHPIVQYVFTKVTGDTGLTGNGDYTGWDPFFESQGGGKIYNAIFNLTNSLIHTFSFTVNPMEDVTTTLTYTKIFLERGLQSASLQLVQPDGTNDTTSDVRAGDKYLGSEVDFDVAYAYTEDVQIGASFGIFKPGDVLSEGEQTAAKQVIVNVDVAF